MAAITSAASGNWSNPATWTGGVVPTSADDVTIQAAHTVTLDNTSAVANTLTLNGTLACSTSASSKLTTQQGWTINATGNTNLDVSGNVAVRCDLVFNAVRTATGDAANIYADESAAFTMKGFYRKRVTTLVSGISAGATSATVADATGWQVGDKIVLATTQAYNATPRTDEITIVTVNTGTGAITWTGGVTYAHAAGGYVGNFSSNMTLAPSVNGDYGGSIGYAIRYGSTRNTKVVQNVLLSYPFNDDYRRGGAFGMGNNSAGPTNQSNNYKIYDCAVYQHKAAGLYFYGSGGTYDVQNIAFYSSVASTALSASTIYFGYQAFGLGTLSGVYVFRTPSSGCYASNIAIAAGFSNSIFSACSNYGVLAFSTAFTLSGVEIFACLNGIDYSAGDLTASNLSLGTHNAGAATNSVPDLHDALGCSATLTDCSVQTLVNSGLSGALPSQKVTYVNKNKDVTQQEIYRSFMAIKRDNSNFNRSTSSVAIYPTKISTNCQRTVSIPCAAGAAVRVIGYVKKSHASNIAASVALSGLGSAWGGFTAAANTNWQQFDTGNITNSSGVDGNFTLTYTANSSSGTTNVAYFDGVPDSPFVTKCRHYGFMFDESNPVRVVNPAVTASEATAAAYTGVTINTGTPQITVATGTANTFKKVYDFIQSWACLNLGQSVPMTSADGNNFTVPMTWKLSWPTMGTDGTLIGGWLLLGTPGTYTHKLSGTKVDFTAAGTYNMGGSTFGGTVELVNSSGGAVTVALPTGTSYTNTGPSITVTAPTVTQGLAFTGLVAGSQVVVFATGSQTELFRDNASATAETWSQAGGTDATVDYTIFKDGYLPIRVTGITVNSAVVGVPVQQAVDPVYVTPAGLTWSTTASVNKVAKTFGLGAASTGQNWYSFMVQQWRQQATLQNVDFPLTTNGPNSIRLQRGWEFSGGLSNWTRDGLAYFDTSGVRTAAWAAVLTSGTAAGHQVRYLQSDGGSFVNAANTGPMDQLVQVYGDASHGNFDRTGFLVVKIQKEGFDQAEADIYGTYSTLEDQLYVVGLQATPNSVAASSTARAITIADSPVTWNGKVFSLAIDATGLTGTQLMQWLRYSFAQAGSFQGKPTFNWHDLVQTNGAKFKTVRGVIHGDASSALKGVRVLASGAAHPDFDTFTADDGTTYSPPVTQSFTVDGLVSGSYVQVYDVTNSAQLAIGTSTTSFTWVDSGAATGDRQIRLRVAYCSGASAKEFIEVANAGTCGTTVATANKSYTVAQKDDAVYNANAIAGSGVTGITISDAIDRMQINIAGGTVSWRSIYAYNVYWLSTAAGIVDDGSIITAKDQANYSVTLFKIKNTSATPLKITQGWGVDATTGTVEDIIDTTGGNIYPVVDHVVSSVVSVGGANIITGDIADIPAAVWAHNIP